MKCKECGANLGMFKKYVNLADGAICKKCFERLGFDFNDAEKYSNAKVSEIQTGYGHYTKFIANKDSMDAKDAMDVLEDLGLPTFRFTHYGEEREVEATEGETEIFNIVSDMLDAKGYDPDQFRLVRKSDNYVAVAIGDSDVARMKYTERAKWIVFPSAEAGAIKHHIKSTSEIAGFDELLTKSIEQISKFKTVKRKG